MNLFSRKPAERTSPQVELTRVNVNAPATLRETPIEALAFHPDPELTQRIEDALTLQRWARKVAYRAQLRLWAELADVVHTPEQIAAIQADQARRIAAMGGK
jgi:hypothetical protein